MSERIQKVLANAGLGSRREIDRWVLEGRVTIDGRAAQPGDQLSGRERVCVDGRPVRLSLGRGQHQHSFLAYYKPTGESSNRDESEPKVAKSVAPAPPKHGRWINVGGLDTNTSGLLLLTTDGELAHRLMHPRSQIEREYAVRLLGHPTPAQVQQLLEGFELEDGPAKLDSVEPAGGTGSNVWYHVVLREGGSRELRALFDAIGLAVSRVIRVRYGPLKLGELHRGDSRPLNRAEIDALYKTVHLPRRERSARSG
ncbi:MAG TPA: pseudouridine synthase [Gammaproteobacteria bacterium]|nr:pseudouridine synthase [Gammaproteobacteria bacterium]